jgi:hypothetical protein
VEVRGSSAPGIANGPSDHIARTLLTTFVITSCLACAPTVNVLGVYFPGWLVSTLGGVVFGYAIVYSLGRRSGSRRLAESGLLFVSLVVGGSLAIWWTAFSRF